MSGEADTRWKPNATELPAKNVNFTLRFKKGKFALRYYVLFSCFAPSSILPLALALPLQAFVFANAFIGWFMSPPHVRRGVWVAALVCAISFYWVLLMGVPNVPNLQTAIFGFRKTIFALSGIMFGMAVPVWHRRQVSKMLLLAISCAVTLSIISHLWLPEVAALAISDNANFYTSQFGGERRMQGVFVGPFHAAIAAGLIAAWSLVNWKTHKRLAPALLLLALIGLYLPLVRTIYVAMAGVICVLVLLSPNSSVYLKRTIGVLLVGIGLLFVQFFSATNIFQIATSIGDLLTDQRFLYRLQSYETALTLIGKSPLFGWGAGSAGDTLGVAFASGVHVTSHNLILKILVEGGLVGGVLWGGLISAIFKNIEYKYFFNGNCVHLL